MYRYKEVVSCYIHINQCNIIVYPLYHVTKAKAAVKAESRRILQLKA